MEGQAGISHPAFCERRLPWTFVERSEILQCLEIPAVETARSAA